MATIVEMETIVEIEHLTCALTDDEGARTILHDLNLHVGLGEIIVVFGASGVGKSTLLRALAGLTPIESGSIRYMHQGSLGCNCALVFQEPRLLPWRRTIANVALGLEGGPLSREQRYERARAALQLVRLGEYEQRWPYRLSGGQRQRVGLARALAVEPEILLMDEPFSSLDIVVRRSLQAELLRIWQAMRSSILFVTHDLEEAVYLADRVLLLAGTPANIVGEFKVALEHPRDREGIDFLALKRTIRELLQQTS